MTASAARALITGASAGIGAELARVFAAHGHDLVVVARRAVELQTLAAELQRAHGVDVAVRAMDLARREAPAELHAAIDDAGLEIGILVNNAGFGTYGEFATTDLSLELEMLQLNVATLTALTKLFLPDMLTRGGGRILNVASTAAFQPGPLMAAYYASKAYVLSLTEALAAELRGSGVTATALCPGPTRSEFQARAGMAGVRLASAGPFLMDARTVAELGYRGLLRGRAVVVPGLVNKLGVLSVRLLPRRLVTAVVRRLQSRAELA